jgi:hypothetical protein
MRASLICLAAAVCCHVASGEQRTWTISYTTDAELLQVQGNTVYLKASDGVQMVPLDRLSESDRQYVASLPLAPMTQVVANRPVSNDAPPAAPNGGSSVAEPATFVAPQEGPALVSPATGGERSVLVPRAGNTGQPASYEPGTLPTPPDATIQPRATQSQPQFYVTPGVQSNSQSAGQPMVQQPLTPMQQRTQAKAQRRADADTRRGLLGGRRRLFGGGD